MRKILILISKNNIFFFQSIANFNPLQNCSIKIKTGTDQGIKNCPCSLYGIPKTASPTTTTTTTTTPTTTTPTTLTTTKTTATTSTTSTSKTTTTPPPTTTKTTTPTTTTLPCNVYLI